MLASPRPDDHNFHPGKTLNGVRGPRPYAQLHPAFLRIHRSTYRGSVSYGGWGLITNGDATAYDLAEKEYVPATVTDLQTIRVDKSDQCQISFYQSGRNLSVVTDDTNPCYQNNNTPIHVDSAVRVEYWNGKPTAVYLGDVSWPTSDNPAHKAALAATAMFFGGLIGVVVAVVGAIHLLIWFSSRKAKSPSA